MGIVTGMRIITCRKVTVILVTALEELQDTEKLNEGEMKQKIKNILIKTSLGASIATAIVAVAAEGSITTPRAIVFGVCVGCWI